MNKPLCFSLSLVQVLGVNWRFDLFSLETFEAGTRLTVGEVVIGNRSGALIGFDARASGDGRNLELSFDILWKGLRYGEE